VPINAGSLLTSRARIDSVKESLQGRVCSYTPLLSSVNSMTFHGRSRRLCVTVERRWP
jgi:hypothetical protein